MDGPNVIFEVVSGGIVSLTLNCSDLNAYSTGDEISISQSSIPFYSGA